MKKMHEEIARVAYELYEKRGRAHGNELEDWLEAEKIVLGRTAKKAQAETKKTKKAVTKKPAKKGA